MTSRGKRIRPTPQPPSTAASAETFSDGETPTGAGAAERKRELERNRRNLVNVRFAELEQQLASLPGAPSRVQRRLDKEVVLKDAAQGLASQQRDLDDAVRRITSMTAEIEILRSEKLELRHDKAYLHKELDTARAENAALAADNLTLWAALRKAGAVKLPLDGLLRPTHALRAAAHPAKRDSPRPKDAPPAKRTAPPLPDHAPDTHPHQDLFPAYPDSVDTPTDNPTDDNPAKTAVVAACDCLGDTAPPATGPDFLKAAQDFRARGLSPAFMLQYGFDEQRDLAQMHAALDDVSQQSLPDIAPCG